MADLKNYLLVTSAYWGFTLTDGALRMLVLLHFYQLGYSPFQIALLFLLYEFFGIVTNLLGGWIGSRYGLKLTLTSGLLLQVFALAGLAQVDAQWPELLSIAYVMAMQALSGIAKDLTKMSSKSAIKLVVPENEDSRLFKWVALLTGSKNTLKGAGFFLGGLLLSVFGFQYALYVMSGALMLIFIFTQLALRQDMGRARNKVKFSQLLSRSEQINLLSAARVFLFGARDIWFVVGLPVYLSAMLDWSDTQVGGFMASWVIIYGMVQAGAPRFVRNKMATAPSGYTARNWVLYLLLTMLLIAAAMQGGAGPWWLMLGLVIFGALFAINSSVHSYLILAYTERDHVAVNVGFYYMANACGRLLGTLLSGLAYQEFGIQGCLWTASAFLLLSLLFSARLANVRPEHRV